MSTSSPFLVVSGGDGFYITASLNESLLGKVHVGDTVMASSWENGQMYEAEIVQISDFPNDNSNYYYDGSSNPNSSTYQFTARIADADAWALILLCRRPRITQAMQYIFLKRIFAAMTAASMF